MNHITVGSSPAIKVTLVSGVDRNNPDKSRSHLYADMQGDIGLVPMCDYGWNRSDGEGFSIFRGWTSARGQCQICARRAASNALPIFEARPHKTKWL